MGGVLFIDPAALKATVRSAAVIDGRNCLDAGVVCSGMEPTALLVGQPLCATRDLQAPLMAGRGDMSAGSSGKESRSVADPLPGRQLLAASTGGHLAQLAPWSTAIGSASDSLWVTLSAPPKRFPPPTPQGVVRALCRSSRRPRSDERLLFA